MKKMQGRRLQSYGHVRRDGSYLNIRVQEMEVQSERARARPKWRWMNCVRDDMRRQAAISGRRYTTGPNEDKLSEMSTPTQSGEDVY